MNYKSLPILAAVFAASVTASPVRGQGADYTVISSDTLEAEMIMPDRVLPPSTDPGRVAAERWVRDIPVKVQSYATVLQDAQGNYIQCVGVSLDNASDVGSGVLPQLPFDAQANSMPLLRALHPDRQAPSWPFQRGGCISITAADAGSSSIHALDMKLGEDLVGSVYMRVFQAESAAQQIQRQRREIEGSGVSIESNRWVGCPSAGWDEDLKRAQPGERLEIRGLCPQ